MKILTKTLIFWTWARDFNFPTGLDSSALFMPNRVDFIQPEFDTQIPRLHIHLEATEDERSFDIKHSTNWHIAIIHMNLIIHVYIFRFPCTECCINRILVYYATSSSVWCSDDHMQTLTTVHSKRGFRLLHGSNWTHPLLRQGYSHSQTLHEIGQGGSDTLIGSESVKRW